MLIGHSLADSNGVILAIDESVSDFLWRPHARMLGTPYLELTHPADRVTNARLVAQLKSDVAPLNIRKRYLRGDGVAVWANVQVSRVGGPAGRLVGAFEFDTPKEAPNRPYQLWCAASDMVEKDRLRRTQFGPELFGDHAWTLLMEIYLAEAEGRGIDNEALAALTSFPLVLVERWLTVLEERGVIEGEARNSHSRQLTQEGIRRIERVLGDGDDEERRGELKLDR